MVTRVRNSALSHLSELQESIRQTYLQYPYPWVIGYSGGKDSTTTLQLCWYALRELEPEQLTKPIYVISTDTKVETPVIVDRIQESIRLMNESAKEQNLNLTAHKLSPILNDTFWVNLIGRGYPAPNSAFRWCTERLKINPSNRFILEKVAQHGEVILVLGSRRDESATRNQVLDMHKVTGMTLARHGQLPGAWVYMPIEQFTTDDIWTYLMQVDSPWGGDNMQLASLYQSAQDGECPLVVDDKTSSCGNSRFGCWVCTVVNKDKSMEAMIDSGEEWMVPLLDYRDWLSSTQNPDIKPEQREFKGRDGRIKITESGKLRWRTYTLDFSKEMLRKLLATQTELQIEKPEMALISEAELREIRRIWLTERQDWADSLPKIVAETTNFNVAWEQNDAAMPGQLEADLLTSLTAEKDVPIQLVQKLLDAEWQHQGMFRRAKIHDQIEKIFGEDWRSWDEVAAVIEERQAKQLEQGT
ncbi:MAG: DNA phosphorothioation system sulfurtransferase DndC [Anaerolineales bacterium]|nr:DNA phosphorothioation system sulfurtransferase DndC [Anaerolineales bacterium]